MQPNTLLNIVGVCMIVLSSVGLVFVDEEETVEPGSGKVDCTIFFPLVTRDGPGTSMDVSDGTSRSADLLVDTADLASLTLSVAWQDGYRFQSLSPAIVTIKVTSPDGNLSEMAEGTSSDAGATITFPELCLMPSNITFEMDEDANATEEASSRIITNTTFSGAWKITIEVERSYLSPVHPLQGSVSFTVKSSISCYNHETRVEQ